MPITVSTDANPANQSVLLQALSEENAQLKRQLAWFKNQLFGAKSEKRVIDNPDQPLLTGGPIALYRPAFQAFTSTSVLMLCIKLTDDLRVHALRAPLSPKSLLRTLSRQMAFYLHCASQ